MKDFINEKIEQRAKEKVKKDLDQIQKYVSDNYLLNKLLRSQNCSFSISSFLNNGIDKKIVANALDDYKEEVKKKISDDFFDRIQSIQDFMRDQ